MSELAFDAAALRKQLADTTLAAWSDGLASAVLGQEHALKHGHLPQWESAVSLLPSIADASWSMQDGRMTISGSFTDEQAEQLSTALSGLMPWRKGPFQAGPVHLDTEWRSDWKWNRLCEHIQPMDNRVVLDVGCGSGYHLWCMRAAGARLALGIDPSLLYLKQFDAIQHYANDPGACLLPLPMEALPSSMQAFDTVFSMGVLYHRRDPAPHLEELRQALKSGGELVLETLVIPDSTETSLAITGRYANMRNIYELPSVKRLENWVRAAGFNDVRAVSVEQTSLEEQRSTAWMPSHSLDKALDPENPECTIEGYPRPLRAVILATV
ncbi:tRNA 5-methoxyuridine(34)/uridine 5-oxyacetic acid(34) synthase CmoB [Granulosicoccus antarcticus]|uniref:tRNA U34 carboxymethyltransferase n=1 Tax=Granulosicoccus antarcticus IMCC3135 TaxID=1192854 RepID=A0A2Z2P3W8_9GAMM|nr:tRNA 5-methoxyuridine(34)/uridine 5-oxyacetic acid(34) synthase CmoB [Granulosicoccus antarcticus]ASJ74524.1 tRNA U34 carboxymethyltransferase [Granulosicoccus antarcticus IMCC3135]